ncbi:MAG: hypothetical protein AABZ47_04720 [Planctomycetota bacterium]
MSVLKNQRLKKPGTWMIGGVALLITAIAPAPGLAYVRDERPDQHGRENHEPVTLDTTVLVVARESAPEVAPAVEPLPTTCASDADCTDGLYCNGEELCAEGACAYGEPPCPEGYDCDESLGKCFTNENVNTQCAALGDHPRGRFDRDTFRFDGHAGEEVKFVLDVGEGSRDDGRARLVLYNVDHEFDAEDEYKLGVRGPLPLEINTVLRWSGEYRVVVRQETRKNRREPGPYQGSYCLTFTSSDGAAGSLDPMRNVEQPGEGE